MNAPDVDEEEFERICRAKKGSPEDDYTRHRFELRKFYETESITRDLVEFDNRGKIRPKVRTFVTVKLIQRGSAAGVAQFDHDQHERRVPVQLRGSYAERARLLDHLIRAFGWKIQEPSKDAKPILFDRKDLEKQIDILIGHPLQYEHYEAHLGRIPRDWRTKPIRMLN